MQPAIGYALREANRPFVNDPAWNGVEIHFQRANQPLRLTSYLDGLAFDYVSVHTLDLSVASPEPPPSRYLDEIRAVAEENGAAAVTDHLGFTHGAPGGPVAGHVTAPPFTPAALDATCRNVDIIQRHLPGLSFYLENLAHFFLLQGTMPEAEFVCRVLETTGCGLLLDVTNVYANVRNFGGDGHAFIRAIMTAARRVQIHLAGGFFDEAAGRYIDSHSEPIPDAVWELYRYALGRGRGKVDAVFIERDARFPDETGWRAELHQARRIAREVEAQS